MAGTRGPEEGAALGDWAPWAVPEWDELVASSLELAAPLLRARWCALFLLEPGRQRLALAKLWGEERGSVPGRWEFPARDLDRPAGRAEEIAVPQAAPVRWLEAVPEAGGPGPYFRARAPVKLEEARLGVVEALRSPEAGPFLTADLGHLRVVARQMALHLRNGALYRQLCQLASTDGLTGVHNYRHFQERLVMEVERAGRYGRAVSLIMLDLNNFKRYNDLFGHQAGDEALRSTALTIQRAVRRIDVVARYGGDEFVVILPETGSQQALAAAARIAEAVREQEVPVLCGEREGKPISASVGVSSFPEPAHSAEELISQADKALYRAKRSRLPSIRLWALATRRRIATSPGTL